MINIIVFPALCTQIYILNSFCWHFKITVQLCKYSHLTNYHNARMYKIPYIFIQYRFNNHNWIYFFEIHQVKYNSYTINTVNKWFCLSIVFVRTIPVEHFTVKTSVSILNNGWIHAVYIHRIVCTIFHIKFLYSH